MSIGQSTTACSSTCMPSPGSSPAGIAATFPGSGAGENVGDVEDAPVVFEKREIRRRRGEMQSRGELRAEPEAHVRRDRDMKCVGERGQLARFRDAGSPEVRLQHRRRPRVRRRAAARTACDSSRRARSARPHGARAARDPRHPPARAALRASRRRRSRACARSVSARPTSSRQSASTYSPTSAPNASRSASSSARHSVFAWPQKQLERAGAALDVTPRLG